MVEERRRETLLTRDLGSVWSGQNAQNNAIVCFKRGVNDAVGDLISVFRRAGRIGLGRM